MRARLWELTGWKLGPAALVLAVGLVWIAPAAQAGGTFVLDRPDLLDVETSFVPEEPVGNASYSYAYMDVDQYLLRGSTYVTTTTSPTYGYTRYYNGEPAGDLAASGRVVGSDGSNAARFDWVIFEPDTVQRNETRASLIQRHWLFVRIVLSGEGETSTSTSGIVEDCRGKMVAAQSRRTMSLGAIWNIGCARGALASLGLDPTEEEAFLSALGVGRSLRVANRGTEGLLLR